MRPARMNEIPVIVQKIVKVTELVDEDYRDILPKTRETQISFNAQVNYNKTEEQDQSLTGDAEDSFGRLVVRKKTLDDRGIVIQKGDIIISINSRTVNYQIIDVIPRGHLRGIPLLYQFDFVENMHEKNSK